MTPPEANNATPDRVNRLYWESDETVSDIAKQLEMSQSTLYAALEPRPTGIACSRCGASTQYLNRTGRAAGEAVCSACGTVTAAANGEQAQPVAAPEMGGEGATEKLRRFKEDLSAVPAERAALIGGAAALGVALGAAAVKVVRKKS